MNKQDILNAIQEAEIAIQKHYEETIKWQQETGFPDFWIAHQPFTSEPPIARYHRKNSFERVRNHKQGHGWKANHQS